ncbi:MAG: T9SS type A sorting domain-containing protein, partial [Rhodothermales bacterium]
SASIDLMESFFLGENFPDPLTNTTTIRYYLDYEAVVSIHVFDSSGRRVSTLVNAFQEGDQWHVTSFDAGALANGTYFYRMQADGFAGIVFDQTKTLVVAR